jgi:hypothetical protein
MLRSSEDDEKYRGEIEKKNNSDSKRKERKKTNTSRVSLGLSIEVVFFIYT